MMEKLNYEIYNTLSNNTFFKIILSKLYSHIFNQNYNIQQFPFREMQQRDELSKTTFNLPQQVILK